MFCANCGNQLADDANFCPNCGTARSMPQAAPATAPLELEENDNKEVYAMHLAEPADEPAPAETTDNTEFYSQYTPPVAPQPAAKKKGGKTALLMLVGLAAVVILALVMLFSGGGQQADENGIYAIVEELDVLLADSFEHYSIEYNEEDDYISIATWSDDIAEATQYVDSDSELFASWQTLRSNMSQMSGSAKEYVEVSGYENTSVIVSLLNDLNRENVLLLCIDGQVFYDCTEE